MAVPVCTIIGVGNGIGLNLVGWKKFKIPFLLRNEVYCIPGPTGPACKAFEKAQGIIK